MKEHRYISTLDTLNENKLKISDEDIFRILRLKKLKMIASYEKSGSSVDHAKNLIEELEKLQYLWSVVEQNSSSSLDQFRYNLSNNKATSWVCIRQEIEALSCDLNMLMLPYLKMGDGLFFSPANAESSESIAILFKRPTAVPIFTFKCEYYFRAVNRSEWYASSTAYSETYVFRCFAVVETIFKYSHLSSELCYSTPNPSSHNGATI